MKMKLLIVLIISLGCFSCGYGSEDDTSSMYYLTKKFCEVNILTPSAALYEEDEISRKMFKPEYTDSKTASITIEYVLHIRYDLWDAWSETPRNHPAYKRYWVKLTFKKITEDWIITSDDFYRFRWH